MVGAVTGERAFSTANSLLALREEILDGLKSRDDTNKAKLKGIVKYLESLDRHLILRAKNTGSWLNVWGTTVTGTVL